MQLRSPASLTLFSLFLVITPVTRADPTGACCVTVNGQCQTLSYLVTQSYCETYLGGTYAGDGVTTCTCGSQTTGACCAFGSSLTCVVTNPTYCGSFGGDYQGDATVCGSCPPLVTGACCLSVNGSCSTTQGLTELLCLALGGNYGGDDSTSCDCTGQVTGACCLFTACFVINQTYCLVNGGVYNGDDSSCETSCPTGACCLPSGSCGVVTQHYCDSLGGTYQGVGVQCNQVSCPQPPSGACCISVNGQCNVTQGMIQSQCLAFGGTYGGDESTTCDCIGQITGACCLSTSCIVTNQTYCQVSGGSYRGNDTTCESACPLGACCAPSGTCGIISQPFCQNQGGTWQGAGTDCTACPGGACCLFTACYTGFTQTACQNFGGAWHGEGSTTCPNCGPTGACCVNDDDCQLGLTQDACESLSGKWEGPNTTTCDSCPPIPDDHGNDCGTATAITPDGAVNGIFIDPTTDEDWLSFNALAGHLFVFSTFEVSAQFYIVLEVYASDCATLVFEYSGNTPNYLQNFVTTQTGPHYIRVRKLFNTINPVGYCELGLTDNGPVADDHGNSRAAATALPTDGTIFPGVVNYLGDQDWFHFSASAQTLYAVEVRADFDYTRSTLYVGANPNGLSEFLSQGGPGLGPWVRKLYYVPAGQQGDYYVRILADLCCTQTGNYEIRVFELSTGLPDDHGNDCGTATAITPDGAVNGIFIDPTTDEDWLSFNALAGHLFVFSTFEVSAQFYIVLEVYAPDCATLVFDYSGNTPFYLQNFIIPQAGTHYIRVRKLFNSNNPVGYCELGLTDSGPITDDHGNSRATAAEIPTDGTVLPGSVNYLGDQDWFHFSASAQTLYAVEVRADFFFARGELYVGANPNLLGDISIMSGTGLGPWVRLHYYVPAGQQGDYYVRVLAELCCTQTGNYEIRVFELSTGLPDDHGNDCGTATAITPDGAVNGIFIDPTTDEDWLSFNADANHLYDFSTIEVSAQFYLVLEVYAPDCAGLLFEYSGNTPDYVETQKFVTTQAGPHYIRVRKLFNSNNPVGYCELGLTDSGPITDDYGNSRVTAAAIPTDGTIFSGVVNYDGDQDWFRFSASAQTLYAVEVRADFDYTRSALYVGANPNQLGEITSQGDPDFGLWVRLLYYVPAGQQGDYFVRVRADFCCTQTGNYEIRVKKLTFWVGGAGLWSVPTNWNPVVVPDNTPEERYHAFIAAGGSNVTLDISPTIDSLYVGSGNELHFTDGDLTIAATGGIENDGLIDVQNGHSITASSPTALYGTQPIRLNGPAATLTSATADDIIENTGFVAGHGIVSAALLHNGVMSADATGQMLTLTGPFPVTGDGALAAVNDGILLIDKSISGSCNLAADGGTISIPGTTLVTVAANLLDVLGGGTVHIDGIAQVAPNNVRLGCSLTVRGCIPPILNVIGMSTLDVTGDLSLRGDVQITIAPTATVTVGGNFDNQSTAPLLFDWSNAGLTMTGAGRRPHAKTVLQDSRVNPRGASSTFEMAGNDFGPADPAGFVDNFALGRLRLDPSVAIEMLDAFDNAIGGSTCEVLYVDVLDLGENSTLYLHDCNVYYDSLLMESGSSVVRLGAGLLRSTHAGDLDGNNVIDSEDIDLFIQVLLTGLCDPPCMERADLNGDGIVDGHDIPLLIRLLTGW